MRQSRLVLFQCEPFVDALMASTGAHASSSDHSVSVRRIITIPLLAQSETQYATYRCHSTLVILVCQAQLLKI